MYPLGTSFGFKALFPATLVKDINHFFFSCFSDHSTEPIASAAGLKGAAGACPPTPGVGAEGS